MNQYFTRLLPLPDHPEHSFFLWGPRQAGKSTLLRERYGDALWIDLLKSEEFIRYSEEPWKLREETERLPQERLIVIDEIQKVPALLDEVHWLIENKGRTFGLCGSSARKVRRGHANLLGGRAVRYELYGLTARELGKAFDLPRLLTAGTFPRHYLAQDPAPLLRSYVDDYLKEEIHAEGLVRKLPTFSRFLAAAALTDTELVNFTNIARECGVSSHTVQSYFEILEDTLLGHFLPAYAKRPKRRVIRAPKFYFTDVGTVNALAKRGTIEQGSALFGKAFENWVHHELRTHRSYSGLFYDLTYWRTAGGVEVDFILGDGECAIEAKGSARIADHDLKGLREFAKEHSVRRRALVAPERRSWRTEDGIDILPVGDFIAALWEGSLIA